MRSHPNPGLWAIVSEASVALTRLDAERLEEMARSCDALIGGPETTLVVSGRPEEEADNANRDMAIFGRVLQATNSNLKVMRRLRERSAEQLEYSPASDGCSQSVEGERGVY